MNFPDTPVNLVGVDIATFIREGVGVGDSNGPNTSDLIDNANDWWLA